MARQRAIVVFTTIVLVAVLAPVSRDASPGPDHRPAVESMVSVPSQPLDPVRTVPPDAAADVSNQPVEVSWPAAGVAVLVAGSQWTRAENLPVWVRSPAAGKTVQIEVLDQAASRKLGVAAMLLRVHRSGDGPLDLKVDYSSFAGAAGASFGARLQLVRLPGCALDGAACTGTLTPLETRNSATIGQVSADLGPKQADPGGAGELIAIMAAPAGSTGSFAATKLAPSATWQAGLQSGDFRWSYPLAVPPVPGPKPALAIEYSSSSVDGRAGSSNNQPSWVGEGFDLSTGYIERSYRTCKDDGAISAPDLCWVSDNATVSMEGLGGSLVRNDTAPYQWRPENDNGWKVEKLEGASNGARNGEHWRLTSPDGTQYYFGLNRVTGWTTGKAETNSVWTAPVFGNQPGEPCYSSTLANAWCQQAYRWNLDYVVDRHGDAMSYWYTKEGNVYGRWSGNLFGTDTAYTRGGYLSRIDYGQRDGTVYTTSPGARVAFTVADRCKTPGSACTSAPANWPNWPDVPWDESCSSSCTYYWTPTFWTTKRLSSVTTSVWAGSGLSNVDSWTLRQTYPNPYPASEPWSEENDASKSLWLNGITRAGLYGGSLAMPEVTFSGVAMKNRHNGNIDFPSLYKFRVSSISTESGGRIDVVYSTASCGGEPYIIPDQNVSRCYPRGRLGGTYLGPDVFYKYVVTQVSDVDSVGGSPAKVSQYEYVGDAAWHYDDSDSTATTNRNWNQWRGYGKIRIRTGNPGAGPQTLTEQLFMRGMDNDRLANGTRRDVWVTDSAGERLEDHPRLSGFTRETIVYNGSSMVNGSINWPYLSAPLVSRARPGLDPIQAFQVDTARTRKRIAQAGGGVKTTEEQKTFDPLGRAWQINDLGDVATAVDDTCSRTTFAASTTRYLTNLPSRQEKVSVACTASATLPTDLISDERLYYDNSGTAGDIPAAGNPTRHDKIATWGSGGQTYLNNVRSTFDGHGRAVDVLDPLGNRTRTAFTPAAGGPVTEIVRTNAVGLVERTSLEPARGQPTGQIDASNRRTDAAYDALGRLTCVWLPAQPRTSCATANTRFLYQVRKTGANYIQTSVLQGDGSYTTSYALLDGLLRERQTQAPSPAGGRVVTDTFYDTAGRVAKRNSAYHTSGVPSDVFVSVADSAVPAQSRYTYDEAGRQTADIFYSLGVEKWRTTTTYTAGDTVAVDPPDGETATVSVFDIEGRITELRQFSSGTPSGAYDATRYTYTKAGQLATITDAMGNVWRYTYDLRGRKVRVDDPDAGTVSYGYDDEDRLVSTTDARGRTLTYAYDAIGRKTGMFEGSVKLAEWTYDTAPGGVGLPATSASFAGGNAYRTEVLGYDPAGQPIGRAVTIPASETGLAGRYQNRFTYNQAGQVQTVRMPYVDGQTTVGGLADETLTYAYTPLGLASSLAGSASYVAAVAYTNLAEPQQISLGGNVFRTYTYDPATRRVTRDQFKAGPGTVADRNYTYDHSGNVLSVVDGTDTQCFRYDHLRRMTGAWTPSSGCAGAPAAGSLGGPAPYWHSYGYDKVGNRTVEVQHSTGGDTTRAYAYPVAGQAQPHTVRSVTTTGPTGSRTDNYTYDAVGNTTGRPGQTLNWDSAGHLSTVSGGTSYVYDADGNRLLRRDSTGTTLYLDGMELRRTTATATVTGTRLYLHGGTVVASRTPGALTWLGSDQHGTAESAVDAGSLAVTMRRHLPFGGTRGTTPAAWPNERGFVGGNLDPGIGLVHLGAREYDPTIGRFLSADPVTDVNDPQQLQGYAYAENNPATFSDPDGRLTRKQKQKQLMAELQKELKHLRAGDALWDILTELVELLKKSPNDPKVREKLNLVGSILNSEVDDIYKELGAASLTTAQKKSLKARITSLADTITLFGELIQTVLGNKFADWRAAQNAGESLVARGEAWTKGSVKCEKTNGAFWVCGGSKWTFKGREYTHGNVFISKRPTDELVKNKLLLIHEVRHATQWALFDIWFPVLYAKMDELSKRAYAVFGERKHADRRCTDPGACYNPFEIDAGLFNGGYFHK